GARRPQRVGPAVWQALYFAVGGGLALLLIYPFVGPLVSLGGHEPRLQHLEGVYLRCLLFAGLPVLLTAAVSAFFTGRGGSRTVTVINVTGLATNAGLGYLLVFGNERLGVPVLGIAGAGWATVVGCWASTLLALALFFRPRFRDEYGTW